MPLIALLYLAIAIYFAVHAVKQGRELYWIIVLFSFPFLGSLIYFLAVWLPDSRHTRNAIFIENKIKKVLNPEKELREAKRNVEISPTIDANLRLANALVAQGYDEESLACYRHALTGPYENSPDILLSYAQALFSTHKYAECKEALDKLRAANPDFQSPQGHLLYAMVLSKLGQITEADEEFHALLRYNNTFESRVLFAEHMMERGNYAQAKENLESVLQDIKHIPKHAKQHNRQWRIKAENMLEKMNTLAAAD